MSNGSFRMLTASPTTNCSSGTKQISIFSGFGDESLEDSANLPDPDVLALEIAEELEARWSSLRRLRRI
jgi:hypothetical protein